VHQGAAVRVPCRSPGEREPERGRHEGARARHHHLPRSTAGPHRPQFSMVMTCNTLPAVPDNDVGTYDASVSSSLGPSSPEPTKFNEMDPDLNPSSSAGAFVMMLTLRCVVDRGQKFRSSPPECLPSPRGHAEQDMLSAFIAGAPAARGGRQPVRARAVHRGIQRLGSWLRSAGAWQDRRMHA
jgi:hypothetical protein